MSGWGYLSSSRIYEVGRKVEHMDPRSRLCICIFPVDANGGPCLLGGLIDLTSRGDLCRYECISVTYSRDDCVEVISGLENPREVCQRGLLVQRTWGTCPFIKLAYIRKAFPEQGTQCRGSDVKQGPWQYLILEFGRTTTKKAQT